MYCILGQICFQFCFFVFNLAFVSSPPKQIPFQKDEMLWPKLAFSLKNSFAPMALRFWALSNHESRTVS